MAKRRRSRAKRHNTGSPRLRALGFASYEDYLRSSHWKGIRRLFWASGRSKQCVCCDKAGRALHHFDYGCLGHETLDDLVLVCEPCHSEIHRLVREGATPLRSAHEFLRLRLDDPERVVVKLPAAKRIKPLAGKKKKKKKGPAKAVSKKVRMVEAENDRLHAIQARNREQQELARIRRGEGLGLRSSARA
jgi:hypothetical protein